MAQVHPRFSRFDMSTDLERLTIEGFVVEASASRFPRSRNSVSRQSGRGSHSVASPKSQSNTPRPPSPTIASDDDVVATALAEYDDERCGVCGSGEAYDDDHLMCCEGCGVWVHQRCYGEATVPAEDWCAPFQLGFSRDTGCPHCHPRLIVVTCSVSFVQVL